MQYCNHCKVSIRINSEVCPLCGNILPSPLDEENGEEIFPKVSPFFKKNLTIKIMIFLTVVSIVVSFAVDMIFPSKINWPILFLLALASAWLSLFFILRKRDNISKKIMWQVIIVSLLSLFWDWKIGWYGWSIDFVIPITYIVAMVVMYITSKIMRLSTSHYITYGLLGSLFGIIPLLFILFKWNKVRYPSIICVAISIIFLSAMIIFHGSDIKLELRKRTHL